MSSAASNRVSRRWAFAGLVAVALAAVPWAAWADVVSGNARTATSGGPADPESPGAAVIKPLESIVPNPRSKAAPPIAAPDGRFLHEMRRAAQGRVDAARLAAAESAHPCVRKYAEQLVEDYGALIEEIDTLAAARRLSVPTALEAADRQLLADLQRLSGAAFDRRFVYAARDAQQRDVQNFRRHAGTTQDKELMSFSGKAVPTIGEHLRMAGDLATMVNGGGGAADGTMPRGAPAGCSVF